MKKVKNVIKKIIFLKPLKRYIIFESSPEFTDNTYWFFKYLVKEKKINEKYKLIWFVSKEEQKRKELCNVPIVCVNVSSKRLWERYRLLYYLLNAKLIIDSNRFVHKVRQDQIRVYLGHGMPLKMANEYMKDVGECDLLPILGRGFRAYYEQFVSPNAILDCGYPRNDILLKRNEILNEKKTIVWLPTYRQHKNVEKQKIENMFPLGIPIVKEESDWSVINNYLVEKGVFLYFRPHPAQDMKMLKINELSNIVIIDDVWIDNMTTTLYEILSKSDALITDYSSVYYDYLLTGKTIGVTLEDASVFSEKWKLFFKDIENELPGVHLNNLDDLLKFIDDVDNKVDRCYYERERLMKELDIKNQLASKKIWDYLERII